LTLFFPSQYGAGIYFCSAEILYYQAIGSEKKGSNPRAEFYAKYKQEAEHADKDFQKKYEEDLNTTLIFVCSSTRLASTELTFGEHRPVFSQQ